MMVMVFCEKEHLSTIAESNLNYIPNRQGSEYLQDMSSTNRLENGIRGG